MDFLQNINLGGNELKAFRVENATPSTISAYQGEGRLYYYNKLLTYYTKDDSNNTITLNLLTNKNGSIENANLAHSSVTIAGGSVSLGGTLAATAMVTSGSTTAKISLIGIVSGESQFKLNSNLFIEGGVLHAHGGLQLHQRAAGDTGIDLNVVNIGTSANPVWALHTSLPFYSDSSVSAGGIGTGGSGGGGDVSSIKIDGTQYLPDTDGVVTLNLAAYVKNSALTEILSEYAKASFGTESGGKVPLTVNGVTKNLITAHQSVSLASGTNNGTLKLTVNGTTTDNIAVKGWGNFVLQSDLYDESSKVKIAKLPDAILGQVLYGGTVNGTGVCTLSANFKAKYGITSLTLSAANASLYEGAYFIASANGTGGVPSTLGVITGDWVISDGSAWQKIDNTDAVTSVAGYTGAVSTQNLKTALGLQALAYKASLVESDIPTLSTSKITGLPGTLSDYASRISSLEGGSATSVTTTGSGNVVTAISKSGTVITVTKGSTALLSGTTTSSIPEGNNKYYTDARVLAATDGVYEPLIAGDVDIKNSEFYFRPTADDVSVSDGTAKLQMVKGNAAAVNQRTSPMANKVENGLTYTNNGDGTFNIVGTVTSAPQYNQFRITGSSTYTRDGRKYLILVSAPSNYSFGLTGYAATYLTGGNGYIWSNNSGGTWNANICMNVTSEMIGQSVDIKNASAQAFDLTQMFGAGNEPSELTDPRIKWLQSLGYIPYNAGSLVPLKMTGIETTGVNQWDEEWEPGGYNYIGAKVNGSGAYATSIRCKNFIKVLPNTEYYLKSPALPINGVNFYDSEKRFISLKYSTRLFTTPSNCHYITFDQRDITTYNHDIQVALYHSGGTIPTTYHPYEKHTLALDVTAITANGNRIFADGMKAAGTVYDELTGVVNGAFTKAVKRVGKVDLGDLTWITASSSSKFAATISGIKALSGNGVLGNGACARYAIVTGYNVYDATKVGIALSSPFSGGNICVYDPTYSTAAAFKTAMSGVYLYYELATPIEYDLDYPIPCEYYANDWGTEALIPQGLDAQGIPATAPLKAEIAYGINVKDTIRLLPVEYQRISGRVNSIGENSDDNHYPTARAVYRNLAVRTYDVTIATSEAFTPATYEFENDKLVASLYDANGNVVYADMQAVADLDGKYTIRVEFASTSADTFKLVVIGKLA